MSPLSVACFCPEVTVARASHLPRLGLTRLRALTYGMLGGALRCIAAGKRWSWLLTILLFCDASATTHVPPLLLNEAIVKQLAAFDAASPLQQQPVSVSLPDSWDKQRPGKSGVWQYDVHVPLTRDDQTARALFIPRAGNSLTVVFNGHRVIQLGTLAQPLSNYSGVPHKVSLPGTFWVNGPVQKLTITVAGDRNNYAGLSQLWVGSVPSIEPMVQKAEWVQVRGVWILAGATLVLGLMSFLLWFRIRQRLYLLYSIASVVWAIRVLMPLATDPFLPLPVWNWIYYSSFSVYVTLVALFALDVVNHPTSALRTALIVFCLVSVLLLVGVVAFSVPRLRTVILALMVLASALTTFTIIRATLQQPETGRLLLCAAALLAVAAGARDWIVVQINPAGFGEYTWVRYGTMLFMLVLAWIVMERFSRAMQGLQTSARFYEIQFARKQSELESTYAQLRDAEKRQAVDAERKRIMREMHDGLGSSLVTAMSLVDRNDSKQTGLFDALNNCMGELRMAVDALQPHDSDLLVALGTLRSRITPALERSGIALKWEVEQIPAIERLTPDATLQLYRFVQEALTNAIKHSGATQITLRTGFDWSREWVDVAIEDNGCGWRPFDAATRKGGGTDSLRARAHALGGIARISALEPGTRVQLSFPRHVGAAGVASPPAASGTILGEDLPAGQL
jgi:signal transduction histidine kinase